MDQIGRYFQDNGVLILILVVLLIFTVLAVLLFLRFLKRPQQEEDFPSGRLFGMEPGSQFSAAIERAQFLKSHEDVARHIATLLDEHFSIPVLAIYAGKAGDEHLMNVLPGDEVSQTGPATGRSIRLPDRLSSAALQAFPRPQMTIAAEFTGAGYQEPPGETGTLVAVLPWRGAFFWGGILIGQPSQPIAPEVFSDLTGPLSLLGDRLGVALEFEKELEGSRESEELVQKTFEFTRSVVSSADEAAPLSAIAREVASLIGADSAAIWRVDPASSMAQMEGSYGLQSEDFLPLPVGQGLAGHIAETRQPLALEDAPSDPRCLFPREARESGIVSYMGAPIISEDRTIGVVEAHSSQPRAWSEFELRLLDSAARFIASAMRRSETQGDRLQVENAYLKLSEALQRLRTRDELMEAAVEVLGHALGVSRAIAIELNDSGKAEPVRYEVRAADSASFSGAVPDDEFISKALSATSEAEVVAINDSRQQSLMNSQQVESLNVLSEMIVPVKVNDQTKGFIYLHQCDQVRQWRDDESGFASRVGRQLSLSLANLRAMEKAAAESEAACEEARLAAEAASRAQTLVASLPEAVIGLDQEGRLTFFNATAREWLGLSNEDIGRMAEMTESLAVTDDSLWGSILSSRSVSRFQTGLVRLTGSGSAAEPSAPTQGATPVPVSITVAPAGGEQGGFVAVISDVAHVSGAAPETTARIAELEQELSEMARTLDQARSSETRLQATVEEFKAAEAEARSSLESSRRQEEDIRREFERLKDEETALRKSAQQLLEINRLKSEFIVNAGRELESSLQSVLGFSELLERGSYGTLTGDQIEAVRGIYNNARRMKQDVEWLVEYGSTRSRRLEPGGETQS